MGTIWVKELTGGLDTRRMPETTPAGVLSRATDGHITPGGEFAKRAAWVAEYTLPPGTLGLAYDRQTLVVFGSDPDPGVPTGVAYQQLQHPDGVTALARVRSFALFAGLIYVAAEFADGSRHHFYDGVRVADWYDGRARASFQVTGASGGTINILIDGVAIMASAVSWGTSNSATAAAIAAAVNSNTSTPDYEATAVGDIVNLISVTPGSAANGRAVTLTLATGMTTTPSTGLLLSGGLDATTTFQPGPYLRTVRKKMYATSGSLLHFSGIAQPTKFTTDATGAGFIDMAGETEGAEALAAVVEYQSNLAVFAGDAVLIWYIDPNPDLNRIVQVLGNTGTDCPLSVTQFGDSDVFYLHESGLRSLQARDSSNAASTSDLGVPIDTLVREQLQGLTETERENVVGLINPGDNRFWLIMKDLVFVFSFFKNAKVSAWSTYSLTTQASEDVDPVAFEADAAVRFRRKVWVRSGDTIYVYGGSAANEVYDATEAEAWLPFYDGGRPTMKKTWQGFDAAVEGQWVVRAAMDPTNQTASDKIATISATTYNDERMAAVGASTHLALRFRSRGTGPAKLSSAVIHYEGKIDDEA